MGQKLFYIDKCSNGSNESLHIWLAVPENQTQISRAHKAQTRR